MSRQLAFQKKRKAQGLCISCSAPEVVAHGRCSRCAQRERDRKGVKPWVPGGRGRPPKNKDPFPETIFTHMKPARFNQTEMVLMLEVAKLSSHPEATALINLINEKAKP